MQYLYVLQVFKACFCKIILQELTCYFFVGKLYAVNLIKDVSPSLDFKLCAKKLNFPHQSESVLG